MSNQYGVRDAACPLSTRGGDRPRRRPRSTPQDLGARRGTRARPPRCTPRARGSSASRCLRGARAPSVRAPSRLRARRCASRAADGGTNGARGGRGEERGGGGRGPGAPYRPSSTSWAVSAPSRASESVRRPSMSTSSPDALLYTCAQRGAEAAVRRGGRGDGGEGRALLRALKRTSMRSSNTARRAAGGAPARGGARRRSIFSVCCTETISTALASTPARSASAAMKSCCCVASKDATEKGISSTAASTKPVGGRGTYARRNGRVSTCERDAACPISTG